MGCGRKHLFVMTFFGYFFVSKQKSTKLKAEPKLRSKRQMDGYCAFKYFSTLRYKYDLKSYFQNSKI